MHRVIVIKGNSLIFDKLPYDTYCDVRQAGVMPNVPGRAVAGDRGAYAGDGFGRQEQDARLQGQSVHNSAKVERADCSAKRPVTVPSLYT